MDSLSPAATVKVCVVSVHEFVLPAVEVVAILHVIVVDESFW
jgi:hypothetical protein